MAMRIVFLVGIAVFLILVDYDVQAETKTCPIDYGMNFERISYNAGESVTIKVESPYGHDCVVKPASISLKILDATESLDGDKILYEETRQIVERTEFYYQLPASTVDYTPFRYLVEVSFSNNNEIIKRTGYFFAQDFVKTPSYDFQVWPYESEVPKGGPVSIIAKICPFFPSSDIGSGILMKYYFTSPSGMKTSVTQTVDPNSDCKQTWANGIMLPNETGTWSVFSTAEWMQQGSVKELKSKEADFVVNEPPTEIKKMTKLMNLNTLKEMVFDDPDVAEQYWGSGIQIFSSFNWVDNGSKIVFMTHQFANKTWILSSDGNELKMINGTEDQFKDRRIVPNQLGDITVIAPSGGYGPIPLYLETIDGTYRQVLFYGPPNPVHPAISPDGRYVVFGSDPDSYNAEGAGVYLIELSKPVPEFGSISGLILAASLISVIGIFTIKLKKNL